MASLPERSTYTCVLAWSGNNTDYETFPRTHTVHFPNGGGLIGGGAGTVQHAQQSNPEELFAASVGSCMMMTILAVFCRSKIAVSAYEDRPEAVLELVERRYKVTKVILRPRITIVGEVDRAKFDTLVEKAHANCFISLSVKSEIIVEAEFISA
jgi:organic hydroperoxide reductase OsmC/OhrA